MVSAADPAWQRNKEGLGGCHRGKLSEAVNATHFFGAEQLGGVEVGADSAGPRRRRPEQAGPEGVAPDAARRHYPDACHHDPATRYALSTVR